MLGILAFLSITPHIAELQTRLWLPALHVRNVIPRTCGRERIDVDEEIEALGSWLCTE